MFLGGGSGGTYSTIRLQQQGKSVVVVEKETFLGGHTNTYIHPITGAPVDYGVEVWENIPVVTDYFSQLGVPLIIVNENSSPFVNDVVDFSTGPVLPESSLPPTNLAAAIPRLPLLHMQLGTMFFSTPRDPNVGTQDLHQGSHTKVYIGYRRSYSIENNKQASSLIPSPLLK